MTQPVPPSWLDPNAEPLAFEDFPGRLLTVALGAIHRGITLPLLAPHRIGLSEWRMLTFVALREPISASEIAATTSLDKGLLSRSAQSLAARGLLRRTPMPGGNPRLQALHLTPAGRHLFETLYPEAQRRQAALLAAIEPDARAAAYGALRRFAEVAATMADDARPLSAAATPAAAAPRRRSAGRGR